MTPVASWSPSDYYTASRRARRLGEATLAQQQIQGVLDEADAGAVGLVEPAPPFPLDPAGGLDSQTYDGPDASSCLGARRGQEGA